MKLLAAVSLLACSHPKSSPSNRTADRRAPDDLCAVIEQVRAAAPSQFRVLRGTKTSETVYQSTLVPADASSAVVVFQYDEDWAWQVTWPSRLPVATRLDGLTKLLRDCAFGSALETVGRRPMGRNGELADELNDRGANLVFGLLGEGQELTLTISRDSRNQP